MINPHPNSVILSGKKLKKTYQRGLRELEVLKSVDLDIYSGEALCILGASGAGKSTLLHLLGTLDRPTSGEVIFNGENLLKKSDTRLANFRNETMGFVFQFHHLLPEFSAAENVMMPLRISGMPVAEARREAEKLLKIIGLKDRLNHYPSEMSGGEQQRVAIARALVRKPKILFADEPTGNLDSENGAKIQDLFFDLQKEFGVTLVVVTHDEGFAKEFPRRLRMADGDWAEF